MRWFCDLRMVPIHTQPRIEPETCGFTVESWGCYMVGEHRPACGTEVICKQVLGELRVTLQRGWSGLDSTVELRRERRGSTFNGEARKAPLRSVWAESSYCGWGSLHSHASWLSCLPPAVLCALYAVLTSHCPPLMCVLL